MNKEHNFIVLREPLNSEKTNILSEKLNQYAFKVSSDATKYDIKRAVETIFSVKVEKVSVINVKGKSKRFRGRAGKRSDWKKAYVVLQDGFTLDVATVD